MVNWKNKYLEAKLKYINAKNKLKQKGGVGDSLYIVQPGNANHVLSEAEIHPNSSTYNYRPEINLDIIAFHKAIDVARLMKYWMETYDTRIERIKDRGIQMSDASIKDLFNILETIYDESNKNPNGYWIVNGGNEYGPIEIYDEIIEPKYSHIDEINKLPNPNAFCKDCDTQFSSRNKLFKHLKDNKCPDC